MRRLKDDMGIVEDRTGERNIEVVGDNITLTKKHEANKFIDLDTLWISLDNSTYPIFVCFKITSKDNDNPALRERRIIVVSGETADQQGYVDDCNGFDIKLNMRSGENADTDLINLNDVGNEGTGVARDIHIYYAYTPMRQEYSDYL